MELTILQTSDAFKDSRMQGTTSRAIPALHRTILKLKADLGSSGYVDFIAARGSAHDIPEIAALLLDSPRHRARIGATVVQSHPQAAPDQDI